MTMHSKWFIGMFLSKRNFFVVVVVYSSTVITLWTTQFSCFHFLPFRLLPLTHQYFSVMRYTISLDACECMCVCLRMFILQSLSINVQSVKISIHFGWHKICVYVIGDDCLFMRCLFQWFQWQLFVLKCVFLHL